MTEEAVHFHHPGITVIHGLYFQQITIPVNIKSIDKLGKGGIITGRKLKTFRRTITIRVGIGQWFIVNITIGNPDGRVAHGRRSILVGTAAHMTLGTIHLHAGNGNIDLLLESGLIAVVIGSIVQVETAVVPLGGIGIIGRIGGVSKNMRQLAR